MMLHAIELPAPAEAPAAAVPALLIHGLFGRARNLSRLGRVLARGRRVVAVDLRSHGDSPHGPLRIRDMADDLAETMRERGLGRAVVVGHSLGGKVGMALALTIPARVARLLVADIAPVAHDGGNDRIARALLDLPLDRCRTRADADRLLAPAVPDEAVRALLLQNLDTRAPMRWRIGLAAIAGSIRDAEGWPPFDDGARFDGPTLFLRGGDSSYVRPEHGPAIRRLFPRARFATIRGAGHWLHVDRPEVFDGIVAAFADAADRPDPPAGPAAAALSR